jgi:hypothetical protein
LIRIRVPIKQFVAVAANGCAQPLAVVCYAVDGLEASAYQHDDALRAHFSTRKLPVTSESIPELKNVRTASVGVLTMASPRKLKDVFALQYLKRRS